MCLKKITENGKLPGHIYSLCAIGKPKALCFPSREKEGNEPNVVVLIIHTYYRFFSFGLVLLARRGCAFEKFQNFSTRFMCLEIQKKHGAHDNGIKRNDAGNFWLNCFGIYGPLSVAARKIVACAPDFSQTWGAIKLIADWFVCVCVYVYGGLFCWCCWCLFSFLGVSRKKYCLFKGGALSLTSSKLYVCVFLY